MRTVCFVRIVSALLLVLVAGTTPAAAREGQAVRAVTSTFDCGYFIVSEARGRYVILFDPGGETVYSGDVLVGDWRAAINSYSTAATYFYDVTQGWGVHAF